RGVSRTVWVCLAPSRRHAATPLRRRRAVPGTLGHVKIKPIWLWMQVLIVVGTVAGMVIAASKLW
ncbi:MAG: hypothetical protein QM679_09950, partial [Patulibacter sp.]